VTAADVGHGLACRQTAVNAFGTATATSFSVTATAGPAPKPTPTLSKLTDLKLNPSKFRRGHRTTITFTLSLSASVSFAVQRREHGVRSGKRCVAPSKKHHHGKRCTRLVKVRGAPQKGNESAGPVRLSWKPHAQKPGKYELTATPAGGQGATVTFTIQKPRHKH
jgi:hypothetical protein